MNPQRIVSLALVAVLLAVIPFASIGFAPCRTFAAKAFRSKSVTLASSTASTADAADADVSSSTISKGTISAGAILRAKSKVLSVAERCNENSNAGVFLINQKDRRELKKAVSELEALVDRDPTESDRLAMLGDWKLLCTTNVGSAFDERFSSLRNDDEKDDESIDPDKDKEVKTRSGPFGLPNPFELLSSTTGVKTPSFLPSADKVEKFGEHILERVRKSVDVTQTIRSTKKQNNDNNDDTAVIFDRVDNIIEFVPLDLAALEFEQLMNNNDNNDKEGEEKKEREEFKAFNQAAAAFFGNVTSFISRLPTTLNVLNVTKTKVTLQHNAKLESTSPVLRTKIGLEKVLLNVAGKSQYLETDGKDIIGLDVVPSIPGLKDLLTATTFDTTYVDEDIRVSRSTSTGGLLEELRVFERKGRSTTGRGGGGGGGGLSGGMMDVETTNTTTSEASSSSDSLSP